MENKMETIATGLERVEGFPFQPCMSHGPPGEGCTEGEEKRGILGISLVAEG